MKELESEISLSMEILLRLSIESELSTNKVRTTLTELIEDILKHNTDLHFDLLKQIAIEMFRTK